MRRKLLFTLAIVIATAGWLNPMQVKAEDESASFEMDFTWNSNYVWRGILLIDNAVFQPSATMGYKFASLNVWGSMESSSQEEGLVPGDFHEIDYTLDFAHSIGKIGLNVGVINYTFPNSAALDIMPMTIAVVGNIAPSSEAYAGVGLDVIGSPSLTVYYDIDLVHGIYVSGGISQSFDIFSPTDSITVGVDLGASVGYGDAEHNEYYYNLDMVLPELDAAFTDALFSGGFSISVDDSLYISPAGYYAVLIDEEIRDLTDEDVNWFYGVSVGISL